MSTRNSSWRKEWAIDVGLVLKAAHVSQSKIARAMGVTPGALNQYLQGARHPEKQGTRKPSIDKAERISIALCEVVQNPRVTKYFEATIKALRRRQDDVSSAIDGSREALRSVTHYLFAADYARDGASAMDVDDDARVDQLMSEIKEIVPEFDKLMFELHKARRRQLVSSINAKSEELFIDTLARLLESFGYNRLANLFRSPNIIARQLRAIEEVGLNVDLAVAKAMDPGPPQFKLRSEIMDAVIKYSSFYDYYLRCLWDALERHGLSNAVVELEN